MSRAAILLSLTLSCARAGYAPPAERPGPECMADEECQRNQRCDDGACVACAAPVPSDPCTNGACYYIAPTGGDDGALGTSEQTAWDSFPHAWSVLQPGDTLVLLDGIYTTSLELGVSGTDGAPITIRAHHDGAAILDGESLRRPCELSHVSHVILEGVSCRNLNTMATSSAVVSMIDSSHVTVRRVTAVEATDQEALVRVAYSSDVVIEDVAAWGASENVFLAVGSERVTFRRCWAELPAAGTMGTGVGVYLYMSSDSRIENCVISQAGVPPYNVLGINVSASDVGRSDRNEVLANVAIDLSGWSYRTASAGIRMQGNRFADNVDIRPLASIFQRADVDLPLERHTAVNVTAFCVSVRPTSPVVYDADFAIHGDMTNSICVGGESGFVLAGDSGELPTFTHDYNVLFGVDVPYDFGTSPSPTDLVDTIEPAFDTATYGDGAYLIPPANLASQGESGGPIGAEVLYRTEAGDLSCVPLWPWPMEERILAERGLSVSWEIGGGLWKTLDGVYP